MYSIIVELCEEKGINLSILAKETGVSRSLFTELKMGRAKAISADKLSRIADYFNVSTDYILGKTDIKEKPLPEQRLSEKQRDIVRLFDTLSPKKQKLAFQIISLLAEGDID